MSTNDITGDRIISKASSEKFRNNFDDIFKKPAPRTFARDRYNYLYADCAHCHPTDWSKRCTHCGLLKEDGSVIKKDPETCKAAAETPNNSSQETT